MPAGWRGGSRRARRAPTHAASGYAQVDGPAFTDVGVPYPPDVLLQDCLRGRLPACSHCANTLVVSPTLLMHHVGFNTSTTHRRYQSTSWQCGWRQPFNCVPDVHTL